MKKPLLSLQLQTSCLLRCKHTASIILHQLNNLISQVIYTKGKYINGCLISENIISSLEKWDLWEVV